MDTVSFYSDIENLSLELLLGDQGDAASLTAALAKLATIVQRANEAGAATVANGAGSLLKQVDAAQKSSKTPQEIMPILLDGLKTIEQQRAASSAEGASNGTAAPQQTGQPESLAQDPELLQDFVLEAREHLGVIETQLLNLEKNPEDREPTHACFRAIHTIKGVAGFLELNSIRAVSHEGETLLDDVRNERLKVTPALIDALLQTADFLQQEVSAVEAQLAGSPRQAGIDPQTVVAKLLAAKTSGLAEPPQPAAPEAATVVAPPEVKEVPPPAATEPAAVSAPESKPAIEPAKAAVPVAPAAAEQAPAAPSAKAKTSTETKQVASASGRSVKVDMEKLDYLADMVGELVVFQSILRQETASKTTADSPMQRNLTQLARITAEVQKTAMSMRMVPIGQLFQKLSRLVRDVSRQVNKTIDLEIVGEEIELDRSIVEELADPLMHMVRNSIDHGVEHAEQRKLAGKNPVGRISLKARHEAGQVVIEIADDGKGLDRARILAKARQKGLVDANVTPSDAEILNLIFEPGFSTAEKVTDLSGRGVGMDVVRKQIQKLRGSVDLQSTPGQGSCFTLRLPLTLAIIDGLVVGLNSERYIVPLSAVREVVHSREETTYTVEGRSEMAMIRGHLLPIVRLYEWLNVTPRTKNLSEGLLIVIEARGKTYCMAVEELLGKQEVVIKNLGGLAQERGSGIAGGAILGDGKVGLILDPDAMAGRAAHA